MYDEKEEEYYSEVDDSFQGKYEIERQDDKNKNVAKAVITVACIGLICAIIDFYVDGK